jgi:hypothetical protein
LWATNFGKKKKTTTTLFTENNFNNCPNSKGASDTLFGHRLSSLVAARLLLTKLACDREPSYTN